MKRELFIIVSAIFLSISNVNASVSCSFTDQMLDLSFKLLSPIKEQMMINEGLHMCSSDLSKLNILSFKARSRVKELCPAVIEQLETYEEALKLIIEETSNIFENNRELIENDSKTNIGTRFAKSIIYHYQRLQINRQVRLMAYSRLKEKVSELSTFNNSSNVAIKLNLIDNYKSFQSDFNYVYDVLELTEIMFEQECQ